MKKCIIALLCLMLILPLNVYAEGTEGQLPDQSGGQTQSENQTPDQSGTQNPGQSGTQNPDQSGTQNPDQSGTQNPDQSGTQNPDQSGTQNPDQSGTQNPDLSGTQNPDQSGTQNPDQSGTQNPDQSGTQNPDQSGTQNPDQSGTQNPDQSGTQNPDQSGTQNPDQSETVPSDHTHVWDVSATVPATCTEEGATAYGCSGCGAITYEILPAAGHKFSTRWTRKAAGHWHACSVCGEQSDFGKHYPGPAATEEKAQICLTCGYTLTAKLGHTHKYAATYTSDETGHWYACSGCDEQKDFEAHSYDGDCDSDCNTCGYLTATAHTYSGTWLSDETGHWDVCTRCQAKSPVEPHIPGTDATEAEAQTCMACSFELAPALEPTEHVHEGEGAWLTDDENHWKACPCGEETEKQPHNWDDGEEQEDTTILYTCEDCGITRTEGEPKEEGGIRPLVWIGAGAVLLLAAAALIIFLVIPKGNKAGKFGK